MYSPLEASYAWLTPIAKPRLSSFPMKWMSSRVRRASGDPSFDALSTTITS
jgi:hypothetical protein